MNIKLGTRNTFIMWWVLLFIYVHLQKFILIYIRLSVMWPGCYSLPFEIWDLDNWTHPRSPNSQVLSLSEQRWSGVHHLLRDLETAVAWAPRCWEMPGQGEKPIAWWNGETSEKCGWTVSFTMFFTIKHMLFWWPAHGFYTWYCVWRITKKYEQQWFEDHTC